MPQQGLAMTRRRRVLTAVENVTGKQASTFSAADATGIQPGHLIGLLELPDLTLLSGFTELAPGPVPPGPAPG